MLEDNANFVTQLRKKGLDRLRVHIMDFAKAANDCSIIAVNYESHAVGEYMGSLGFGAWLKDRDQKREYDSLVETYSRFTDKLHTCRCNK
jgi:hypothetical protein